MDEKKYPLTITVSTVDKATAKIRKINERIARATAPVRRLNHSLRAMSREAGLPKIARGFSNVTREASHLLKKVALIGGAATAASVALVKSSMDELDALGKVSQQLGLTSDQYAQLRYAAGKAGVKQAIFNSSMAAFSKRLGEAKNGQGGLYGYLKKASPALLHQMQHTKNAAQAMGLLAGVMHRMKDSTKKAALASAAFSRAGEPMVVLLQAGKAAMHKDMAEFTHFAGHLGQATTAAANMNNALAPVQSAVLGIKAALVRNLAPVATKIFGKLADYLSNHRKEIGKWVKAFGKKLPGALKTLKHALGKVADALGTVVKGFRNFFALQSAFEGTLKQKQKQKKIRETNRALNSTAGGMLKKTAGLELAKLRQRFRKAGLGPAEAQRRAATIVHRVFPAIVKLPKGIQISRTPLGRIAHQPHRQPISSGGGPLSPTVAAFVGRRSSSEHSHGTVHVKFEGVPRGVHVDPGADVRGVALTTHYDLSTGPMLPTW